MSATIIIPGLWTPRPDPRRYWRPFVRPLAALMGIATKGGKPLTRGGKLLTGCGCCGGPVVDCECASCQNADDGCPDCTTPQRIAVTISGVVPHQDGGCQKCVLSGSSVDITYGVGINGTFILERADLHPFLSFSDACTWVYHDSGGSYVFQSYRGFGCDPANIDGPPKDCEGVKMWLTRGARSGPHTYGWQFSVQVGGLTPGADAMAAFFGNAVGDCDCGVIPDITSDFTTTVYDFYAGSPRGDVGGCNPDPFCKGTASFHPI